MWECLGKGHVNATNTIQGDHKSFPTPIKTLVEPTLAMILSLFLYFDTSIQCLLRVCDTLHIFLKIVPILLANWWMIQIYMISGTLFQSNVYEILSPLPPPMLLIENLSMPSWEGPW